MPLYVYTNTYELEHAGIKGMKWGVRRYQNPDGSLTDEGRRRYGYGSGSGGFASKNTQEHMRRGLKIGAALGGVVGTASTAVAATMLAVPAAAIPAAAVSAGAMYASSYGISGAAIGAAIGSAATRHGRKYIERNDKGLDSFEQRENGRIGNRKFRN